MLTLDPFNRQLLILLDGKRDRETLIGELINLVKDGTLMVQRDGKPVSPDKSLQNVLSELMENSLKKIAKAALLVS